VVGRTGCDPTSASEASLIPNSGCAAEGAREPVNRYRLSIATEHDMKHRFSAVHMMSSFAALRDGRRVLYDSFNLCAEEHIVCSRRSRRSRAFGSLGRPVLPTFAADPEIRELWERVLRDQKKSYYGF
jgi:hypothetical protein